MSQNLIRNLRSRKLQVHTMSVDSLNGSFTQKCTQIEVYLPGTNGSIKVYEKRINISIDGIQLLFLKNYNLSNRQITEIRNNVPYVNTEVSAIIGSESLPFYHKELVFRSTLTFCGGRVVIWPFHIWLHRGCNQNGIIYISRICLQKKEFR